MTRVKYISQDMFLSINVFVIDQGLILVIDGKRKNKIKKIKENICILIKFLFLNHGNYG